MKKKVKTRQLSPKANTIRLYQLSSNWNAFLSYDYYCYARFDNYLLIYDGINGYKRTSFSDYFQSFWVFKFLVIQQEFQTLFPWRAIIQIQ